MSRVAQGIGVSWGTLKKRCTAHHPCACCRALHHSALWKWPPRLARATPGTEIELQRRDGARLRIHSYEAHLPLATLLRTFLETP